jgi:hypothetical protein
MLQNTFLPRTKLALSRSNVLIGLATGRALRAPEKRSLISTEFPEGQTTSTRLALVVGNSFLIEIILKIAKKFQNLFACSQHASDHLSYRLSYGLFFVR